MDPNKKLISLRLSEIIRCCAEIEKAIKRKGLILITLEIMMP
jgi:hypothetical protein